MKIPISIYYGLSGILEVYKNSKKGPISIAEISRRQKIPAEYLEKIFLKLKKAKILKSIKGKNGGFIFEQKADNLTIGRIIRVINKSFFDYEVERSGKNNKIYVFEPIFKEFSVIASNYFNSITLKELSSRFNI